MVRMTTARLPVPCSTLVRNRGDRTTGPVSPEAQPQAALAGISCPRSSDVPKQRKPGRSSPLAAPRSAHSIVPMRDHAVAYAERTIVPIDVLDPGTEKLILVADSCIPDENNNFRERGVIFAINITLDGSCDHTKMIADEEIHEYFTHVMRDVDLFVFGRKTFQLMVPFWPDVAKNHSETKAMNEFTDTFDSINKIVFSQSFDSAEGNTRIVRTKLQDEQMNYLN